MALFGGCGWTAGAKPVVMEGSLRGVGKDDGCACGYGWPLSGWGVRMDCRCQDPTKVGRVKQELTVTTIACLFGF